MKVLVSSLLAAGLASAALAQPYYVAGEDFSGANTYLIAGIGFEQLYYPGSGGTYAFDETPLGSVTNLYSDTTPFGDVDFTVGNGLTWTPRATMAWDGSNFSSVLDGAGSGQLFATYNGAVLGQSIITTRRTTLGDILQNKAFDTAFVADPGSLAFDSALTFAGPQTTRDFSLTVDQSGYRATSLNLTGLTQNTNGSIQWFIGGQTNPFATTVIGTTIAEYTVDLSSVTALSGVSTFTLVGRVNTETMDLLTIDNVEIIGVAAPIPEPSTYAAIFGAVAAGFALLRRRKA